MTAVPKKKLTEAEYLAIERQAGFKSEFYDGEMFAMSGASFPHNRVKENLSIEIGGGLKGGPCQTFSSDMRVQVSRAGAYSYPDIVVVCGEPEFADDKQDTLLNPVVIVEVLSPSTEAFDRRGKFRRYKRIASLREYVLVAQDEVWCERFVRQPDETWVLTTFDDPAGVFALATLPVRVPLADIYRNVPLPPEPLPPQGTP